MSEGLYSLMRRLDYARVELHGNRSLADVALAAGFADQAHLSRMFKSAVGITPARYRALGSCLRSSSTRGAGWGGGPSPWDRGFCGSSKPNTL